MASTPICRVAASSSVAADELFQRQLDELVAIHRRLERLGAASRRALDPACPHPPATGNFLVIPALREFHRHLESLARKCGALIFLTQDRLAHTQRGIQRLRELTLGQDGGNYGHH